MPTLFRDFESRSRVHLPDVGAWKYATHPSTEIWCCAYAVDEGTISLWTPGNPVPPEFIAAAQDPAFVVCAFNDAFERQIEQHIMGPRYGWPITPIERHRCSQAAALALALPAKLESVAKALNLEQQKDIGGHKLMMQMAKPRRARKDEDPTGLYWFDDAERVSRLYEYCRQDVQTERALHARIGFLSDPEQKLWQLDAAINDRGIHIDGELLDAAINVADTAQRDINTELQTITGIGSINQTKALMTWLAAHGCEVTDLQKPTLQKALTCTSRSPELRRVLELRLDGAHAAVAKLSTMRAWRNVDGRARGTLRYHGASTGRWSSHGIQLQNMKRPVVEDIDAAIAAVAAGDLDQLRNKFPQPMAVVGDITRALICAAPGHHLIAADFSGIESRVTAWLSGQQSKLEQWAKFDRSQNPQDEPYFIIGHKMFDLPADQARVTGQTADLAFGFMGGEGAWRRLAPEGDVSTKADIERFKRTWRNKHQHTVRFWHSLNDAAVQAVAHPGTKVAIGRLTFCCDDTFMRLTLPSGRTLAYPFPQLKKNDRGDNVVVFMDNELGKWVECRHGNGAYGGTWIENVVQAVARDLFAAAMPRLEAAGYPIVLHVHDEIVAEVPDGFGSTEEFLQIITAAPPWADGLPIAAKVRSGQRFCKTTLKDVQTKCRSKTNTPPNSLRQPVAASAPAALSRLRGVCATVESGEPMNLETLARALGGEIRGDQVLAPGPDHSAADRSMAVKLSSTAPEGFVVHSFADDNPMQCRDYVREKYSTPTNGHAATTSAETELLKQPKLVATYDYRDENDALLYQVLRLDPKDFRRRYPNGRTERRVLYRWRDLLARPSDAVFICEGEKDADNVAALDLCATTVASGKWTTDCIDALAGRDCWIIQDVDIDGAGDKKALNTANHLHGVAKSIKIVRLPGLTGDPGNKDVSNWLEQGHSKDELIEVCASTPNWGPDDASASSSDAPKLQFAVPLTVDEWLRRDTPPPDALLGAWLTTTSRILMSADTGLGKTNLGMAIAFHTAAGMQFLHWPAHRPARVLYIDGEMSRRLFKQRIADASRRLGLVPDSLFLFSREDVEDFQPLNTPPGRAFLNNLIGQLRGIDFVLFDNIMSLLDGDQKDEDSWTRILPLVTDLTKRSIGQLWINHTGHDASRGYGTKTREWRLDTVIQLIAVERPDVDLSFRLEFRKARERTPENRHEFENVTIALVDDQWTGSAATPKQVKLKSGSVEGKYLEVLQEILASPDAVMFQNQRATKSDTWRTACTRLGLLDSTKPDSARTLFNRFKGRLIAGNLIACSGEYVWLRP